MLSPSVLVASVCLQSLLQGTRLQQRRVRADMLDDRCSSMPRCHMLSAVHLAMQLTGIRQSCSMRAGWALCGHNAAPIADAAEPAVDSIEQPVAAERVPVSKSPENCASPAHTALKLSQHVTSPASDQLAADDSGAEPPHRAGSSIPRAEKQAVGMLCKQLLDCGRLLWLRLQGFEVRPLARPSTSPPAFHALPVSQALTASCRMTGGDETIRASLRVWRKHAAGRKGHLTQARSAASIHALHQHWCVRG